MKYWGDMTSKWGFSDGATIPEGAENYRAAYSLAVNALAIQLRSSIRVRGFDRPGLHNWCLICFVPVDSVSNYSAEELTEGISTGPPGDEESEPDEAMLTAIAQAQSLDLDKFVTCHVSLSRSARKGLVGLGRVTRN